MEISSFQGIFQKEEKLKMNNILPLLEATKENEYIKNIYKENRTKKKNCMQEGKYQ
jgi:hypothetical protein